MKRLSIEELHGVERSENARLRGALQANGQRIVDLEAELATLRQVDQRAQDARHGSMVDGEPEYESGWLAAAGYIFGASRARTP